MPTKQEFLDQKKFTKNESATLQLLLAMSKTQLLTALRHAKMMHKALYTTEMRTLTFQEILDSLTIAYEYAENGKIDKLENNN